MNTNCSLCPTRRKLTNLYDINKTSIQDIFDSLKKQCKFCTATISKRKYVYTFIKEYFDKYNKTYFTVKNIKKYIESKTEFHEEINTSVKLVIRDMLNAGIIEVDKKSSSGVRYKILNKNIESIETEAITRGFSFEQGIKS